MAVSQEINNSPLDSGVTILIPTFNRPKELSRLLHFLNLLKNPYSIIILDASKQENQKNNKEIASKFEKVTYVSFFENCHLATRYSVGLNEYVTTPYTIICPDDDFIIPETVTKGAQFLDANPEYSAVNGLAKCLAYPKKFPRLGVFSFINDLKHPLNLDQASFLSRMIKSIAFYEVGCPPLFYALQRTVNAKKIFGMVPDTMKYSSLELLNIALTLLWGKSLTLPSLLMIRNYSSEPTQDEIRQDHDYYFSKEDANLIRNILVKELKRSSESLSDEMIHYTLDQFIKIPLSKVNEKINSHVPMTSFSKFLAYKKNWLFYIINFLFPSLSEKLDSSVEKKVVVSLKKAFQLGS